VGKIVSGFLETSVQITVPFHDADPAGIVWHGNYFRYFELARCALLDQINYNYRQMAESGYVWPIVDLSSRFNLPVSFQESIEVVARLVEWEFRLVMHYRVLNQAGQETARGATVQVPVASDSGELLIGVPAIFEQRVAAARAKAGLE